MIATKPKDSKHTISYKLFSQPKKLKPIISDTGHYRYQGLTTTSKEGSKLKSDPTTRIGVHGFLCVFLTSQTSMPNYKVQLMLREI